MEHRQVDLAVDDFARHDMVAPGGPGYEFWARVLAGVGRGLMVRVLGGVAAQPARFSLTEIVALLLPTCEISIWYS